ncbi:MAG: MFS transporter [Betaproteobacteria bacterium]|nr:MFS transporter [Betaproteobacteria bacterium]
MSDAAAGTGVPRPHPGTLRLAAFGLLGVPLAFAALPIYLHVPRFYAEHAGLSLSLLGGLLLALRLLDALIDPFIGAWTDRVPRRPVIAVALVVLGVGFSGLFQPPDDAGLGWLAATLALVTLGYSVATIAYQAWLADADISEPARIQGVALREFFILVGIVAASVLPTMLADTLGAGLRSLVGVVWPLIGLGALAALVWAPLPVLRRAPVQMPVFGQLKAAVGEPRFRGLLTLFAISAIATAVAATLGTFYIADVLEAEAMQEQFFAAYFLCAVASLPAWTAATRRIGFARSWFLGLVLTVLAFLIAPFLGAGETGPYFVLCVVAGLALGSELVVPAAWLAALLAADPPGSERAGACLGWWTLMNKLSLAIAAGFALPMIESLGYQAGQREADGLAALAAVYAFTPIVLKTVAAVLLVRLAPQIGEPGRDTAASRL